MAKPNRVIKQDAEGPYLTKPGGGTYRPLEINGHSHVWNMNDGGLKGGDHVVARHVSSTPFIKITTSDGTVLHWGEDFVREQEMKLREARKTNPNPRNPLVELGIVPMSVRRVQPKN